MKPKHLLRAVLVSLAVAAAILAVSFGLLVLVFGWGRFLADFWPLDASRVGPNLCASVAIVVLVTAHNEYRTALHAIERGESVGKVVDDLTEEVLHPTETAEEHIAAD